MSATEKTRKGGRGRGRERERVQEEKKGWRDSQGIGAHSKDFVIS